MSVQRIFFTDNLKKAHSIWYQLAWHLQKGSLQPQKYTCMQEWKCEDGPEAEWREKQFLMLAINNQNPNKQKTTPKTKTKQWGYSALLTLTWMMALRTVNFSFNNQKWIIIILKLFFPLLKPERMILKGLRNTFSFHT